MTLEEAVRQLVEAEKESLRKHGAYRMVAGREYVAYLRREPEGVSAEVWSWGVCHGRRHAESEDELLNDLHRMDQ